MYPFSAAFRILVKQTEAYCQKSYCQKSYCQKLETKTLEILPHSDTQ